MQLLQRASLTSPRAFTLIEVVVALALSVLLAVGVQSLAVNTTRTARRIEADSAARARDALPFDLLRQDLQTLPAGGGLQLTEHELTFLTLNALQSQRSAARHAVAVRYRITKDAADGVSLVRQELELGVEPDADGGVVLAAGLERVALAVFDGQAWRDRWPTSVPQQARGLRITLTWRGTQRSEERVFALTPLRWRHHHD